MNKPTFLRRKDLARMMEVSTDMVRKNEQRWGLMSFRTKLSHHDVRYDPECIRVLQERGFIADISSLETNSPDQRGPAGAVIR